MLKEISLIISVQCECRTIVWKTFSAYQLIEVAGQGLKFQEQEGQVWEEGEDGFELVKGPSRR